MEVTSGIHQFKVPIPDNPLGYLNAYLIKGQRQRMLVDTGWNTDEALNSLGQQLAEAGMQFQDITHILITHIHPDHYGLAGRLKQLSGAEMIFHEVEKVYVESRYVEYGNLMEEMEQWLRINGVPDEDLPQLQQASVGMTHVVSAVWPDRTVRGGEKLSIGDFEFEVLWTPGHSPGHICLYEPHKRILISGDHVLPIITPHVSLHAQSMGNPLADYVDSLQAVEDLDVGLVLPAHEHIFYDLKKRAAEIRQHHEERKQAILDAIGNGRQTAFQISAKIPWNVPGVTWETMATFDRRSAVMETLAHLELMRLESKVHKFLKDGIAYYMQTTKPSK